MNTQTLILAILNFGDASGYEIKKFSTEGSFSYFVDISYGSIYPTLAKLETDGFVTCQTESQDGKPDKKVYSITDIGRHEFVSALSTPPNSDKFKSEFLLVAICADLTTPEVMAQAIDKRMGELEAKLEMIRSLREECDHPATHWVSRYGEHVKQADLTYLRENRDALMALATQAKFGEAAE